MQEQAGKNYRVVEECVHLRKVYQRPKGEKRNLHTPGGAY